MNCAIITGRFVKDPELRKNLKGEYWTRFTIAVPAPRANGKDADFVRCVAWGSIADFICSNFVKGKKIEIMGELRSSDTECTCGKKSSMMELNVEKAYFGEKKNTEELRQEA